MRVLHIVDPGSPGGGACTLQQIAEANRRIHSIRHDVVVIGTSQHEQLARRCGLRHAGITVPALGWSPLARHALRRIGQQLESVGDPIDVVHAWTADAAVLAQATFPDKKQIASVSVGPVSGPRTGIFTAMMRRRPGALLAATAAVKAEYLTLGLDEDTIEVLPPAVHEEAVHEASRARVRARLQVSESEFLVGLLCEPVSWADARIAALAVSLARSAGRRVRLVVHPEATRHVEARRWARSLDQQDLIVYDHHLAEPWRVINGLNAVLVMSGETNTLDLAQVGSHWAMFSGSGRRLRPMPGIHPLLWAMSAGVPIISEQGDAVRSIIEDGVTGLLIHRHDVRTASTRIVNLFDDRTIGGRIGAAAKEYVHEHFNISAFCVRLKDVYVRLMSGRKPHTFGEDRPQVVERLEDPVTTHWSEH